MAVTADDIAVEIGRPTPVDADTEARFTSWIERAVRVIHRQAERYGVAVVDLDEATVDDVVLLAVSAHARNPDGVDTYAVSIDDGSESRRYTHSSGRIDITDEWWSWLFPTAPRAGAFTTLTYGAPDVVMATAWETA